MAESRRTILFLMASILFHLGSGLCPDQCKCDETRLRSDCSEGKLNIVPIFLNPGMRHLSAHHNLIRHLEGALNVYADLEELDLSHNEFHSLGQHQFMSQTKLQQLNLSNNFISSLHMNTFAGPQALQILDLSHNILGSIHDETLSSLVSLVELRLSHNKIVTISTGSFSGLSRLRTLNLDHNLLEVIDPMWMIPLENLRFLYLSHNGITTIGDDSFRPLSALKVLSVQKNRIFNISQLAFRGLRSLDTIDLSDNQLSYVPNGALSQLQQLLRLHLSGNPIVQITRESFQSLYTLDELHLNRMVEMVSLDGHSFIDNTNIKLLKLENNKLLKPLPWGLFATNGLLQDVSFRNNSWTSLAIQQVPQQSLRKLQLSGLPLHCNCSLIWLWELYQRQNETHIQLDTARCDTRPSGSSDSGYGDSELEKMSPDQLSCDDWTHILVVVSASTLCVIFVILAAAVCLYKIRVYRMREKYGTPCFHIKDDTMIYRGTLGSPLEPFKTVSVPDPDASGSYSPTEPFYEVPKYGDEDPKSSSASSGSKYSSSGYVGSELWENDYFSNGVPLVHCYVNPTSNPTANPGVMMHSRTLQRSYGGSPQGSSGMGSSSGTSTGSNGSGRILFTGGHPRTQNGGVTGLNNPRSHQTLMWMHGSPNKQYMDKFSTGSFRLNDGLIDQQESIVVMPNINSANPEDRAANLFSSAKRDVRSIRSPKDTKNRNFRTNVYV